MGRCIVKLADDKFIEWSSVVDAPVSAWLIRTAAAAQWGEDRVARADRNGHSARDMKPCPPGEFATFNRAGPNEESLTLDAIIRRYATETGPDEPLTPADILPSWSNGFTDDGKPDDDTGPIYEWRPWRPGEAPDVMPDPAEYHRMATRIPPDELERLTAEVRARAGGEQRG